MPVALERPLAMTAGIQWRWNLVPKRCVFAGSTQWMPRLSRVRTVQAWYMSCVFELRWLLWHIHVARTRTMNTHMERMDAHEANVRIARELGWYDKTSIT